MNPNSNFICLLFVLLLAVQCRQKDNKLVTTDNTILTEVRSQPISTFDSVLLNLGPSGDLSKSQLVAINAIDTSEAVYLDEMVYCDTTVYLNDSILFTIVSVGDIYKVCAAFYLFSINKLSKKVIESVGLYRDCDVDFSADRYTLYEYSFVSNYQLLLKTKEVFQKKEKLSQNEDENIDHIVSDSSIYTVSQLGWIIQNKK